MPKTQMWGHFTPTLEHVRNPERQQYLGTRQVPMTPLGKFVRSGSHPPLFLRRPPLRLVEMGGKGGGRGRGTMTPQFRSDTRIPWLCSITQHVHRGVLHFTARARNAVWRPKLLALRDPSALIMGSGR